MGDSSCERTLGVYTGAQSQQQGPTAAAKQTSKLFRLLGVHACHCETACMKQHVKTIKNRNAFPVKWQLRIDEEKYGANDAGLKSLVAREVDEKPISWHHNTYSTLSELDAPLSKKLKKSRKNKIEHTLRSNVHSLDRAVHPWILLNATTRYSWKWFFKMGLVVQSKLPHSSCRDEHLIQVGGACFSMLVINTFRRVIW